MKQFTRGGLFLLILLPFFFSSCLYRNIKSPGPSNQVTQFSLDTDDFEILGTVESTGTYKTWVWLVMTGGNSYVDLQDRARAMGGDEIIHYRFNVTDYNLLFFIYNKFTYHASATVIKYKPAVLRDGRFQRQELVPEELREAPEAEDEDDLTPTPAPEPEKKADEKKADAGTGGK